MTEVTEKLTDNTGVDASLYDQVYQFDSSQAHVPGNHPIPAKAMPYILFAVRRR